MSIPPTSPSDSSAARFSIMGQSDRDKEMFNLLGGNLQQAQIDANKILADKNATPEQIATAKDSVERAKDAFSVFLAMRNIVQSIIKEIIQSFKQIAS